MWMKTCGVAALLAAMALPAAAVDVAAYVKRDRFKTIKLSPTGEYYAATVPLENVTALVIMRRADNTVTGTFRLGKHSDINDFWWVNPDRVLISTAVKIGELAKPQLNGELYAMPTVVIPSF